MCEGWRSLFFVCDRTEIGTGTRTGTGTGTGTEETRSGKLAFLFIDLSAHQLFIGFIDSS